MNKSAPRSFGARRRDGKFMAMDYNLTLNLLGLQRRNRDNRIIGLADDLFSTAPATTAQAFEKLCEFFNREDIRMIKKQLLSRSDIQGTYWFVQYLVAVECQAGFKELSELMAYDNKSVRETAALGMSLTAEEIQVSYFVEQLKSPHQDMVAFAAVRLGKLRRRHALFPLMAAYDRCTDPDLLTTIVEAIGEIGDLRSWSLLSPITVTSNKKLQDAAFSALEQIARTQKPKLLDECLKSDNPKIREKVYLSMIRLQSPGWDDHIALALKREPESVKLTVISTVFVIENISLFRAIFDLAVGPEAGPIKQRAQTVMRRVKSPKFLDFLLKEFNKYHAWTERKRVHGTTRGWDQSRGGQSSASASVAQIREFLLRLLIDHLDDQRVRTTVKKVFIQARDPVLKFISLQAMGYMPTEDVRKILLKSMDTPGLYRYPSMVVFLEAFPTELSFLVDSKRIAPDKDPVLWQVALYRVLTLHRAAILAPVVRKSVEESLGSDNPRVRILAVKCLVKFSDTTTLNKVWEAYLRETQDNLKEEILKELVRYLNQRPDELSELLDKVFLRSKNPLRILRKVLLLVEMPGKSCVYSVSTKCLALLENYRSNPRSGRILDHVRIMVLLRSLLSRDAFLFLDLLRDVSWSDRQRLILMRIINSTPIHSLPGINVDFMAEQYQDASKETRLEFLRFFNRMPNISPAIESIIFMAMTVEEDVFLYDELSHVVNHWLNLSLVKMNLEK